MTTGRINQVTSEEEYARSVLVFASVDSSEPEKLISYSSTYYS